MTTTATKSALRPPQLARPARRAQVKVVRDAMIEAFPEGEDATANAEAYMAEH